MSRYLVTGADGFIGRHLVALLQSVEPHADVLTVGRNCKLEVRENCMDAFMAAGAVDYIFHLADVSGNAQWSAQHAVDQFFSNTKISTNVLEATAVHQRSARFIGVSSLWAYPSHVRLARESDYWTGPLVEATQHYGFNKKLIGVGLQACKQQYGQKGTVLVLGSAYGPGDRSDHVIPSLIQRMSENQKSLEIWGNGYQRRDFTFVEDQVRSMYLHRDFDGPLLNISSGSTYSIRDVVSALVSTSQYAGEVRYQSDDPGEVDERALDISLATAYSGWPSIHKMHSLEEGIRLTLKGRQNHG